MFKSLMKKKYNSMFTEMLVKKSIIPNYDELADGMGVERVCSETGRRTESL